MYNNQVKSPKRGEEEKKTGQLLRNNKVLCYFLPIFPFKEFLKHDAVSHSTSLFNTQRNWESIMPVSSGNHAFQKQSLFRSFVLWHIQHCECRFVLLNLQMSLADLCSDQRQLIKNSNRITMYQTASFDCAVTPR